MTVFLCIISVFTLKFFHIPIECFLSKLTWLEWNLPAPVEVRYRSMRFITHNPTTAMQVKFIEELKKYGVTIIVRVCEAGYDTTCGERRASMFLDYFFDDTPPSNQIVDDWLSLEN